MSSLNPKLVLPFRPDSGFSTSGSPLALIHVGATEPPVRDPVSAPAVTLA
jgi:hypothetical protein